MDALWHRCRTGHRIDAPESSRIGICTRYVPLELNIPLVVGGAINWYVTTRSKDASLNTERGEKGTLLASGFIAGGALMGVVSAAMRFGGINLVNDAWLNNTLSQLAALIAYALLILYFIKASMKVK